MIKKRKGRAKKEEYSKEWEIETSHDRKIKSILASVSYASAPYDSARFMTTCLCDIDKSSQLHEHLVFWLLCCVALCHTHSSHGRSAVSNDVGVHLRAPCEFPWIDQFNTLQNITFWYFVAVWPAIKCPDVSDAPSSYMALRSFEFELSLSFFLLGFWKIKCFTGRGFSPLPNHHSGGPGFIRVVLLQCLRIYVPQRQGGSVMPPGTGSPF
jgi:hypothetical protein